MVIECELTHQGWNPQSPLSAGDSIRTIVQFPLPDNFNTFADQIKENCFKIEIGEKKYDAVAYQPTDKSQSVKINIGDNSVPTLVIFLIEIYAWVEVIADIINASTLTLHIWASE